MIIPNFDFITTLLNIKTDQVEKLEAVSTEEKVSYYVSLKSDRKECPYCGGALISNGYGREKPVTRARSFSNRTDTYAGPAGKRSHRTIRSLSGSLQTVSHY